MDKKIDTLYDLCDIVSKELETANEKINNAGGELSAGDLEYLDKLTHTLKSLKTSIMYMENDLDNNSGFWDDRYRDSMENRRGGSYARGGRGNSNARGGSYRGGRGDSYARGGRSYGRDESREDFIAELEMLIERAPDERTKQKFEHMLNEMQ